MHRPKKKKKKKNRSPAMLVTLHIFLSTHCCCHWWLESPIWSLLVSMDKPHLCPSASIWSLPLKWHRVELDGPDHVTALIALSLKFHWKHLIADSPFVLNCKVTKKHRIVSQTLWLHCATTKAPNSAAQTTPDPSHDITRLFSSRSLFSEPSLA